MIDDRRNSDQPARDCCIVDFRNVIEQRPVKIVQARPGVTRANHRRGVAGRHPALRRRQEPQVLGQSGNRASSSDTGRGT